MYLVSKLNHQPEITSRCALRISMELGGKIELQTFIDIKKPHILAVQETKIDDSVSTAELFPSELGFSVLQSDRNLGGGGVLLAIRQNLNPMSCLALAQGESVWAKVHLDGQVHYFRSIYRPPQQSPNELLHYLFLQS